MVFGSSSSSTAAVQPLATEPTLEGALCLLAQSSADGALGTLLGLYDVG